MLIVPQHKLLQRRRRQRSLRAPIPESLPLDRDRRINVQQNEERSPGECFDYAFVVDGSRDEILSPVCCCVVQEGVDVREFGGLVAFVAGDCDWGVGF